jgi:hypothetical protein
VRHKLNSLDDIASVLHMAASNFFAWRFPGSHKLGRILNERLSSKIFEKLKFLIRYTPLSKICHNNWIFTQYLNFS